MRTRLFVSSVMAIALAGCATAPKTAELAATDCGQANAVKIIVSGPGLDRALVYDGEGANRYYPEQARLLNAMGSTIVVCDDLASPDSCKAEQPSSAGFDVVGTKLVGSFLRVQPINGADGRYEVRFVMLERTNAFGKRCAAGPVLDLDLQV
ncbi:MAG: hypothetical protein JWO33_1189 [Caulobacteraceae bacterium]|nr:hypothetical protein [Caulobacteraceae bacterium]